MIFEFKFEKFKILIGSLKTNLLKFDLISFKLLLKMNNKPSTEEQSANQKYAVPAFLAGAKQLDKPNQMTFGQDPLTS